MTLCFQLKVICILNLKTNNIVPKVKQLQNKYHLQQCSKCLRFDALTRRIDNNSTILRIPSIFKELSSLQSLGYRVKHRGQRLKSYHRRRWWRIQTLELDANLALGIYYYDEGTFCSVRISTTSPRSMHGTHDADLRLLCASVMVTNIDCISTGNLLIFCSNTKLKSSMSKRQWSFPRSCFSWKAS